MKTSNAQMKSIKANMKPEAIRQMFNQERSQRAECAVARAQASIARLLVILCTLLLTLGKNFCSSGESSLQIRENPFFFKWSLSISQ